jgi:hypothetical protein
VPNDFKIRPAQFELGAEFGGGEVVAMVACKAERPEWKTGIDIGDTNFRRSAPLFGDLARARLGLNAMLNEAFRDMWMRFGNAGKLVGPLEHAFRRRAGSYQKSIENVERKRGNTLRPAQYAGRCDRHFRKSPTALHDQRAAARNQANIRKKLNALFKKTGVATDRLEKCDTFASMIRKKLPRANSLRASIP